MMIGPGFSWWLHKYHQQIRDMEREADRNAAEAARPKTGDPCPRDCPGDLVEDPPRCWWCDWGRGR